MNPKRQVYLIIFSTLIAAFSLASIIAFTDPKNNSWLTFSFFYASLFLVSLGSFTLIGLLIRKYISPALYIINLNHSFRQALLVSILVVITFILLSQKILFWWVELSLILFLTAIEVFLSLKI